MYIDLAFRVLSSSSVGFPWVMRIAACFLLFVGLLGDARAQADVAVYKLQPGDTVEVWIGQQPDLNRDVLVRPDGRISMPMAGHLRAEGLSVEELEEALKDRLREFFKVDLDLTLMLSPEPERPPPSVYVSGDVAQPGAYPYRPGMTVLHAVTLAGGYFRPPDADGERLIQARGEIDMLERRLVELLIREARQHAELGDRDQFTPPREFSSGAHASAAEEAAMREKWLFDLRREELPEVEIDREFEIATRRNIAALQAQIASVEAQLDLSQRQLATVEALAQKGLASSERPLEINISIAALEAGRQELQAQLLRVENDAQESARNLRAIRNQRREALLSEIGETRTDIEETRARIVAHRSILASDDRLAENPPQEVDEAQVARHFSILRTVGGIAREAVAMELTQIEAADLVRVTRARPVEKRPDAISMAPSQTTPRADPPGSTSGL